MAEWKAKRFWKKAEAGEAEGGFAVLLDGRPVRTPAKALLVLPTRVMAEAVAAEWDAQAGEIDPLTMPVTRAANAAIDKVLPQFEEVAGLIADYGNSDLLCYRASSPHELAERQAEAWDPLLRWAADEMGATLNAVSGVMHIAQDATVIGALGERVRALTPFQLAAFHDLVSLSGSLVIGFAAAHGYLPVEELWLRSRIDENWQQEQWGEDEEAIVNAAARRSAFLQAERFFRLCE